MDLSKKKKKQKTRTYNVFDTKPDFENCNGWSLTVTRRQWELLEGTNIGLFMVNLTTVSEFSQTSCSLIAYFNIRHQILTLERYLLRRHL